MCLMLNRSDRPQLLILLRVLLLEQRNSKTADNRMKQSKKKRYKRLLSHRLDNLPRNSVYHYLESHSTLFVNCWDTTPYIVVSELSYEELEVQGGTDAQVVWDEMINTDDEKQKERMIKDLKEYCRMDTLAMVEIHKILYEV